MDKISIIIPVYNVESYLKKCLDSVINQTYSNLEILLVNDGSSDNSGKICDEYALKDSRIRVFHKENGGVSSAKNVGLKNMSGKYVGFADPDDWLEPDMYETLYSELKNNNVPVSAIGYFIEADNKSKPADNLEEIPDGIIPTERMLLYPLKRDSYMGYCGYLWNKLFATESIVKNNIKFNEEINYGEDILFYYTLVTTRKLTGCYINKPLYHYLQRDTAISKTKSSIIRTDILKVYKKVEELLNENGYKDLSFWARGFYCYHAGVIAKNAYQQGDKETLRQMQNEITLHINDYIETNIEFPKKVENMRNILQLNL